MDVGRLVARSARRYAGRVALDGPQGRQTFAELGERVTRLARGLRALGLRPGDRVLDLQTNQNTYVETDLAIPSAGLVRVALNHRLHPGDWTRIADDCGATALVYDARFTGETEDLRAGLDPDRVVVIGSGPGRPYEKLLADQSAQPLMLSCDADSLCGLHYSSGTTGHPKGARRSHRNRVASLVNMVTDVLGAPPGPDDVYVHAGPITHTSGLFVLPFLAHGATQLILSTWDPEALVDAVENRGATHTALVPTMVARLLALPHVDRDRMRGLKMLGYAGAPMPSDQIRAAHDRLTPNLVQYYGLVEAIPPVTVLDAADHGRGLADAPDLLASAGRPAFGVEVRIVDEDGREVPTGEIGEVVTRGDHVMPGYWKAEGRADLSKSVRSGWLHTGDLGRVDGAERLWLVDRKGDMIISGGYNIYPREVEDVVAQVPGVHEVAVVGVDDAHWGQRVVALITVTPGAGVRPEAVIEHCRTRMASYKKPKEVRVVDSFPLNSTGKIAKKRLREQLNAEGPAAWND
jgi:acyl-CoA synthetase (AMP-forming)/AMP-acid ligase II